MLQDVSAEQDNGDKSHRLAETESLFSQGDVGHALINEALKWK
jgi:hypothetical protein